MPEFNRIEPCNKCMLHCRNTGGKNQLSTNNDHKVRWDMPKFQLFYQETRVYKWANQQTKTWVLHVKTVGILRLKVIPHQTDKKTYGPHTQYLRQNLWTTKKPKTVIHSSSLPTIIKHTIENHQPIFSYENVSLYKIQNSYCLHVFIRVPDPFT